jgi:hypothetical protein
MSGGAGAPLERGVSSGCASGSAIWGAVERVGSGIVGVGWFGSIMWERKRVEEVILGRGRRALSLCRKVVFLVWEALMELDIR